MPPRMLLLSNRNLEQDVWHCGQVEFENLICQLDSVELVTPRAASHHPGPTLRGMQRVARKIGLKVSREPEREVLRLEYDYDLFCVYVQSLGELAVLSCVPDWRKRCRLAVCFIEELWARELQLWGNVEQLAGFDLITVGQHGTVALLHTLTGKRCKWLPGAVDTLSFHPGMYPPPRTIDVFSMGRRSEVSHQVLLQHVTLQGWTYLFDTLEVRRVRGGAHAQHRAQLAELVKRSRYFIANRSRVDRPQEIGDQQEVGFRSLEGAAGGAVLIGDAPHGSHVNQMFDWPDAHVHVPFDSREIVKVISVLEQDPARVQQIRRDNIVNSLRRHDWAHRWHTILGWLELTATPRLAKRLRDLEDVAIQTEAMWGQEQHRIVRGVF